MYKYLLVILEKGAVPFCHYSNPYFHSLAQPEFMSAEVLGKVVDYAQEQGLFLNLLFGKHRLPAEYEKLIGTVNHVKMIPLSLKDTYPDGVLVLEADENLLFAGLDSSSERNIILRAAAGDLPHLADIVESLKGKFKRLNLHLVGQETFSAKQLESYEAQLKKIAAMLQKAYQSGEEIEINVLSDRLLLREMNNCDAGVKHLTVAPSGKAYICPGFYYDDEENAIGSWTDMPDIAVENQRLLDLSCAPLCSQCDAFHCKRCVYLNKATTFEINVPSRQQCLTAHVERDVSRRLLHSLRMTRPFDKLPSIPGLAYNDPFDKVVQDVWNREGTVSPNVAAVEADDYLLQIYEMQKKILRKLGTD
ncbi:MAG: CXXX repeat peptide maturase [Negativicutes bacterium]|nr:CXXX repeat peptide maturase [Negativicutes bacterium]